MSKIKHKIILINLVMVIFSLFLFGCENKTPVEYVKFGDHEIVLLVGEKYKPQVVVGPHYATNKQYTLTTNNSRVVSVEGDTITAVAEGTTTIKVVANDNSLIEDYISVQVRKQRSTLHSPKNLTYDCDSQTIKFSPVDNASSYTLKVGSNIIEIGNSNSYSLSRYKIEYGSAYDQVLDIAVRANAPTYSQAFNNSAYSHSISIYQNSSVANVSIDNGILTFDRVDSTDNYRIEVEGEVVYSGVYKSSYDLTALNERYAGSNVLVKVVAIADTSRFETREDYVNIEFCDSSPVSVSAVVMGLCQPVINNTFVSWDIVAYATEYNILIDDDIVTTVDTNFVDLSELDVYDEIVRKSGYYVINIDPVMRESSNILKTDSLGGELYVNKLDAPELTASNNKLSWEPVELASSYVIKVSGEQSFKASITCNEFSLDNYEAGVYNVAVEAIGQLVTVDGVVVNMLPSNEVDIDITKQTGVTGLSINEYELIFDAVAGDKYAISGAVEDVIEADGDVVTFDLSTYEFVAGGHEIFVSHLGNGLDIFDSAKQSKSFIQLASIDTISITTNMTIGETPWVSSVSVEVAEENEQATIEYSVSKDSNELFTTNEINWMINNVDDEADHYLQAGEYAIEVKVLGDGINTFSANRTGKIAQASATTNFVVLPTPEFTIADRDTGKISLSNVDNAITYFIFTGYSINNIANNNGVEFSPELIENQVNLLIQVVGEGTNELGTAYIGSNLMNYVLVKLPSAQLTYNEETGVLDASYDKSVVDDYVLTQNGVVIDHELGQPFTDFATGDNEFTLKLIAKTDLFQDVMYILNSDASSLNVNKLDENSIVYVNTDNQLVITPKNQESETSIEVKFVCGANTIELATSGTKLVNSTYSLDYTYDSGSYYIDLLDNKYAPIIAELNNDFTVQVKFNTQLENSTHSNYSVPKTIKFATKVTLDRDNQNLVFTNLAQSRSVSDYRMLVNGVVSELPAHAELNVDTQVISINIEDLPKNDDINSIQIITLNVDTQENNPIISVVGEVCKYTFAQSMVLTASKDNDGENNSVIIHFSAEDKLYNPNFVLEIYTKQNGEIVEQDAPITFTEASIVDSEITYVLDRTLLEGEIYISAYVSTVYKHEDIHIFNSERSNELHFSKIAKVGNLRVYEGVLHYDAVDNVVGYDIYKETAGGYTKINSNLIHSTSYALTEHTGEANIRVRAVSQVQLGSQMLTNANMSESVTVYKLETPALEIVDGNLVVDLSTTAVALLQDETIDCVLMIKNGTLEQNISLDMEGVTLEGSKLIIEPELILNYGEDIVEETLIVQLLVNYTDGAVTEPSEPEVAPLSQDTVTYYLNSNNVTIKVKGLLAPKNVIKTSTDTDGIEILEHMTWEANPKNIINSQSVLRGYIVKVELMLSESESKVYYSSDSKLMYATEDGYASYSSVLSDNKILFPAGYDDNENGSLDSEELFKAGTFKLSVKSVPMSMGNENLLCSQYSVEYVVKILAQPEIKILNGAMTWSDDINATNYLITIYSNEDYTTILDRVVTTSSVYDFSNYVDFGLFGVTVKVQSTKQNVISSIYSDMKKVYRMDNSSIDVEIEDGSVILTANNYFEQAEFEFLDDKQNAQTLTYKRVEEAQSELAKLAISDWDKLTDISKLEQTRKYLVKINDSEVLRLLESKTYTLKVKLIGNSSNITPLINSNKKFIPTQTFVKLESKATEIKKGVVEFSTNYSGDSLNYNFNNVVDVSGDKVYWEDVYIYIVNITVGTTTHNIYCVDDKSLANLTQDTDYVLLEEPKNTLYAYVKYAYDDNGTTRYLYFNVFKDNLINFKGDSIEYYPMTKKEDKGTITYSSKNGDEELKAAGIDLLAGGAYLYSVTLLGGDVRDNQSYLSANSTESKYILRYTVNTLGSQDGKVMLGNQISTDEYGNQIDVPVYKLTINTINLKDYTYVYVYHDSEEKARNVTNNAEGEYVEAEYDDEGNVLFDMTQYYVAGVYNVRVQTLAGMGVDGRGSDNFLNSIESGVSTYKKVTDANVKAVDGVITFNQSYITNDLGVAPTYIEEYELTLTHGEDSYCYTINASSEGVNLDANNHVMTYTLPASIAIKYEIASPDGPVEQEEIIDISNGESYTIKARAMTDASFVLNGTYPKVAGVDKALDVSVSAGVEYARIENGALRWKVNDLANYGKAIIGITYENKSITFTTTGSISYDDNREYAYHYYEFNDSTYQLDGQSIKEHIDSGKTYNISLRIQGTSAETTTVDTPVILNSLPVVNESVTRIEQVNSTDIISFNGQIAWPAVDGATGYIVNVYSGITVAYRYTIDSEQIPNMIDGDFLALKSTTLDENGEVVAWLDDDGKVMEEGNYQVKVKAIGGDSISGRTSEFSAQFAKLGQVQEIKLLTGRTVTWTAVENVSMYEVYFSYGEEMSIDTESQIVTNNECTMPDEVSGAWTVHVRIVSQGEDRSAPMILNAEWSSKEYGDTEAAPKGVKEFRNYIVDEKHLGYQWQVDADDFKADSDKLKITYTYYPYEYIDGELSVSSAGVTESTYDFETYVDDSGTTWYYFCPSVMGVYKMFYVQVERTLTSNLVSASGDLDVNLYDTGAGLENNPYTISNATQLMNIKYYPSAHYKLMANIDMSTVGIANILSEQKHIVCEEFSGTLDGAMSSGDVWRIYGFGGEYSDIYDFALFGTLNHATIKNLGFGSVENDTIIQNSFAKTTHNMLKLSLLAGLSNNNTTIDNVIANRIIVTLLSVGTVQLTNDSFIAGLVVDATDTTVTDCMIGLTVNIGSGNTSAPKLAGNNYIGSIFAKASNSDIVMNKDASTATLVLNETGNVNLTYVGGLVGYMSSGELSGVQVATRYTNVRSRYLGGIVGYMTASSIVNASSTTEVTNSNIDWSTDIGGIVGRMTDSVIDTSTTSLTLDVVSVQINNANGYTMYIGAYAGAMIDNNGSTKLRYYNDGLTGAQTNIPNTTTINLGAYGYKSNSVSIEIIT